jgi:hypothetical protein
MGRSGESGAAPFYLKHKDQNTGLGTLQAICTAFLKVLNTL